MAIFDIDKDELLRLSDTLLEELIARLAEAEVAASGYSSAWVRWSGSINAPDGGIDIHVQVPFEQLNSGYIERPDTVFQAKKHKMRRADILREMAPSGVLSPMISGQAAKGGSYIIVSLDEDCSPSMLAERVKAMHEVVRNDPSHPTLHLAFYDRAKLAQWIRQHPSVMLWVNRILGRGYSGWQPYGAWSRPPEGAEDTLITASGITISLPSEKGHPLSIKDAIGPIRQLIQTTRKAVRITGLSGVGKTRIVQALFDESVGADALDRTLAVYADTGDDPNPSATAMLERLIADQRSAIMVLDNCPSELHASLAARVTSVGSRIKLITVEYDIREDKPQTTEVIHIEAVGPEVAEKLLLCRFPGIGPLNARRIAEFADGNARVSLAIAERVDEGESLAVLSDAQLFDRLFEQRHKRDEGLREQAEILSLVYSFSSDCSETGDSELEILGTLAGYSHNQLYRTLKKLTDRHILQARSHWRAILPHAIANKLAASALGSFPVAFLRSTFEVPGRDRILMSFAHRLGLLHDHPVAKEIAAAWLQPEAMLGNLLELDDLPARMLEYIAPVVPDVLLNRIDEELRATDFKGQNRHYDPPWSTILDLLQALAWESSYFDKCASLLLQIADHETDKPGQKDARDRLTLFCQPYLSGTHASLEQRIALLEECLTSSLSQRRTLGLKMLSAGLSGSMWTSSSICEFGARPRDYGAEPDYDALMEWRCSFIEIAVRVGNADDIHLANGARTILANALSGLWSDKRIGSVLVDAARTLHARLPWGEGWKAIRAKLYFMRKEPQISSVLLETLDALERELRPNDLLSAILLYALSKGHYNWVLDDEFNRSDQARYTEAKERVMARAEQLGREFATSTLCLSDLRPNLFSSEWIPYRSAFGKGLAEGTASPREIWQLLIKELEQDSTENKDFSLFLGFIEGVDRTNEALAHEFLDHCAVHPSLSRVLVNLHPQRDFTETDLNRCMSVLNKPDTRIVMFDAIFWQKKCLHLPVTRVLELAERLLAIENGAEAILDGLGMRLHGNKATEDMPGPELRQIGLRAAIQVLQKETDDRGGFVDASMASVVAAALQFDSHDGLVENWLDAIFSAIDKHHGYMNDYRKTIETTVALIPEAFLSRLFEDSEDQRCMRLFFMHGSIGDTPLLSGVDIETLIGWCSSSNDPRMWVFVPQGLELWVRIPDTSGTVLHENAVKFLEAAPEPSLVLESFAKLMSPTSWSGSLANILQSRTDAFGELIEHERDDISNAAKKIHERLMLMIERQRNREQQEDRKGEQRFE
ncbi:hypothetical protein [Serratia sp. Tan611]|uniref:hypothetical protein n=1 Tax=Serratia sp. Tan611 TaxID=2773264 RepID=UPI001931F3F2|nr:hypothetical protein [Serratia sp. Tan611]CAE1143980.1 conserved protein of unknown function [Serratia sp. Tan611]